MKRSLAALSLLALALTACQPTTGGSNSSAGADAGTIKIGFIGPLTGDTAAYGMDQSNGAKLAVDEINAAGGINGKQVQLIVEDGRCNGSDAANAAQKLVNVDHVVAIIGGQCSSETLAAAPIAEAGKVVLLSPWSSSPKVTTAGNFVFRNYPSDALKGKALGAYLKTAGIKNLAMLSENTDYAQGMRTAVKTDLPTGTTLVFDEVFDPGTKDFRTLFTRLKGMQFDAFLANGQSDATVAEMAKQMRQMGIEGQILGTDTADSLNLPKLGGSAVEGLKPLSVPNLISTGDASPQGKFMAAFKAQSGEPQSGYFFAALSYDAAKLIMSTIKTTGPDGEKIRAAFNSIQPYAGVAGTFSFDGNGDVKGIPFAMKVFKDGKLEQSSLIPLN